MAPPARTTNLLAERTTFVGRDRELAAIAELFQAGARLVTIIGPPGIGKTRLACRWGAVHAQQVVAGGGVWFCDLTDTRSVEEILAAVAAALDVPLTGASPRESALQLGRALCTRSPLLLILDNFDQVVGHAADTVGRWWDEAQATRFLVTSRERLHVSGEHCIEVGPLADEHAVRLFEDRARMIRGDRAISDTERAAISRLVDRLDKMPLAIELAAARANVIGFIQLHERISESFVLLRDDRRDADSKRATLEKAIEFSWDLLLDWERAALAQCSVFRGGFSLDAAERIVDLTAHVAAPSVVDVLQSLRDKSLLYSYETEGFPGEIRFGLFLSIHDYAARKLATHDQRDAVAERHGAYYLECGERWARSARGRDARTGLARLRLELDNLLAFHRRSLDRDPAAAARAVLALHDGFQLRGPVDLHLRLLDEAVSAAERAADGSLLIRALLASSDVRVVRGQIAAAHSELVRARDLAAQTCDAAGQMMALVGLARVHLERGEPEKARESLGVAYTLALPAGERRIQGLAELTSGIVDHYQSRLDDAAARYESARAIFREVGDRQLEARTLCNLAIALMFSQDDQVVDLLSDALRIFRDVGDRFREGQTLSELARVHADHRRDDEAERTFSEALAIARDTGHRRNEGAIHTNLGLHALDQGRLGDARHHLEEALFIHRETHHQYYEVVALTFLGVAELTARQFAPARGHLREGRDLARELGAAVNEKLASLYLAAAELASDRVEEARANLEVGLALVTSSPPAIDATFAVLRGFLDLVDGRSADAAERIADAATSAARSLMVRITVRLLEAAIAADAANVAGSSASALEVAREARWFRVPGRDRVDLSRRGPARLVLERLVQQRSSEPDRALSVEELARAGWPGERVGVEAETNRVYAAISTLRRLGLGRLLVTRDDGYLLDPSVPMVHGRRR